MHMLDLTVLCIHSNRTGSWKQSYASILGDCTATAGELGWIIPQPDSCAGRRLSACLRALMALKE